MAGLDALAVGGGVTDPVDARNASGGLLAVQGPTALDIRTGVLVGPGTTALITGTADTGQMTVQIGVHHSVTSRGTANGPYLGPTLNAATKVNIAAAPGSGSRIDVVYEKQQDGNSGVPSPDVTTAPLYGVLQGASSTGTPTKPDLTTIVGASELGTVTVAAGAASTNDSHVTITQTARQTTTRGGVILCRTQAERQALTTYATLQAFELDNAYRLWHDGTKWRYEGDRVLVASTAARDALTPYEGLQAVVPGGRRYVYTSGAWGDPLARLAAYASVARTGFAAGWQDLDLNAETIDTHNAHTTGAGLVVGQRYFTCPAGQAGRYIVEGGCSFDTLAAGTNINARIMKNSAVFSGCTGTGVSSVAGPAATVTGSKILDLAVGDTLHVQGYASTAWSTAIFADAAPWLSVERID